MEADDVSADVFESALFIILDICRSMSLSTLFIAVYALQCILCMAIVLNAVRVLA